jgi:O-acetyl-ADP-ribose deacetylase (regulator of RNase III)
MPYGDKVDSRGVVHRLDNVYDKLIVPAVEKAQTPTRRIKVDRADKIPGSGSIHREMFEQLLRADIVVVDITLANANVFYELGIRHALRDRVTVLIREQATAIPFNVNGQKVIGYTVEFGEPTNVIDAIARDIRAGLDGRVDSPVLSLLDLPPSFRSPTIQRVDRYRAPVSHTKSRSIEIVTGDLDRQPKGEANIWVNSENTYFMMARPFERSISATIRWLGRVGDEDTIYQLLEKKVAKKRPFGACHVVITGSGALKETHDVDLVCHVATVQATMGRGYQPVLDIDRAVRKVAEALEGYEEEPFRCPATVLFPLIGTGQGGGRLGPIAGLLMNEAKEVLASDEFSKVEAIRFLALTKADLEACQNAGRELGLEFERVVSAQLEGPASGPADDGGAATAP